MAFPRVYTFLPAHTVHCVQTLQAVHHVQINESSRIVSTKKPQKKTTNAPTAQLEVNADWGGGVQQQLEVRSLLTLWPDAFVRGGLGCNVVPHLLFCLAWLATDRVVVGEVSGLSDCVLTQSVGSFTGCGDSGC